MLSASSSFTALALSLPSLEAHAATTFAPWVPAHWPTLPFNACVYIASTTCVDALASRLSALLPKKLCITASSSLSCAMVSFSSSAFTILGFGAVTAVASMSLLSSCSATHSAITLPLPPNATSQSTSEPIREQSSVRAYCSHVRTSCAAKPPDGPRSSSRRR